MDDFLILLQAKLDEAKSKGNVNADIDKIQQQIDKLKIQATIDPKSISNIVIQLEGVLNQKINISNIGIDTGQISKVGQKVGQTVSDSAQKAIDGKNINVDKLNADIKNLTNNLNNFSAKNAGFDTFKTDIKGVEVSLDSLISKLSTVDNNTDLSTIRSQATALKSAFTEIAKLNEIQLSMDTGETESKIDSLISKTNQWTDINGNARISTQSLTDAFNNLGLAANEYLKIPIEENQQKLIEANEKLSIEYKKVTSEVRSMNAELAKDSAVASLKLQYQNFWNDNGKYHKRFAAQFNSAMEELANSAGVPKKRIEELKRELIEAQTQCKQLGLTGQTWFQNLGDKIKQLGTYLTGTVIIGKGLQIGKQIVDQVVKTNTAMVELTKVSSASASEVVKYFDEAAESAKRYGIAVSDMINATADWSRLGYDLDDAKKLAEVATLYVNVGDGIDMNTANESLISTLQGFKMTADEAIHVIDSFNEVANTEAINSAGIGEALQRSASSMYAAGNTLEETIGLITAANAVVQDPDSIGTAYKTISMRIRGAKTEMEELGLETDGMVESTATLQKEIMALSGVDIMKDENTFKSTYQILDELATKWQDLKDIQQASITELIAGKRQGNIISALMNNFETARRATETAVNSTGSALEEQEKYEKGIEYSLKRLEAVYQTFANHILDSKLVKGIIDFGSNTIEVIDKVTSKLGSLGTIGAGAGLFAGFKNVGMA